MRKKNFVAGIVLALSVSVLAACGGGSKQDYLSDIEAISAYGETMSEVEDMTDFADAAKDLDVKTAEGKVLKKDLEQLGDYMTEFSDMMEDIENVDEAAMEDLSNKMTELQETVEEHAQDFVDAAEKAGVSDEDVEDLGLGF